MLNTAAERMLGYPREDLLGKLIEILVPEALQGHHRAHREHYAERPATRPMGSGLELVARRKDGSELPVEISLSPIRSSDGFRMIAVIRDITARREARNRIDAIHQRFAADLAAANRELEVRKLRLEPFRAANGIAEALVGLRPLARMKRIEISESVDHEVYVMTDQLRFREILYNLVSNAIKFTPDEGRIYVECREHTDGAISASATMELASTPQNTRRSSGSSIRPVPPHEEYEKVPALD